MELSQEMREELDHWMKYLRKHGDTLPKKSFNILAKYIREVESGERTEKLDKEAFQKKVDEEMENEEANKPKTDRVFGPSKNIRSIVDLMKTASELRYSLNNFTGMEPGKGHTAGDMFPGTEPISPVHGEMYQASGTTIGTGSGDIGDGPEVHQGDGGVAQESGNVTLEVWPQGYCNILVGGKPTATGSVGGLVPSGGRAIKDETLKIGEEDLPVVPYRVSLDGEGIRALMELADQGLEYRRQLELDGVRYSVARDRDNADPDMQLRIMRSIESMSDLKAYVDSVRRQAEEVYKVNPSVDKKISDFMRVQTPQRQTVAPATGIGNREFVQKDEEGKTRSLFDNPELYKA